ncbi:MAG: hypothetical protein U0270_11105 [Labilithrix sp.]
MQQIIGKCASCFRDQGDDPLSANLRPADMQLRGMPVNIPELESAYLLAAQTRRSEKEEQSAIALSSARRRIDRVDDRANLRPCEMARKSCVLPRGNPRHDPREVAAHNALPVQITEQPTHVRHRGDATSGTTARPGERANEREHVHASEIAELAPWTAHSVPGQQSPSVQQYSIDGPWLQTAHLEEVALESIQNELNSLSELASWELRDSREPALLHLPDMPQRMPQRTPRE